LGASTGQLFALEADCKEKAVWNAKLVNVPDRVYVAPDGRRVVTIDTYGRLGYDHSVVVYDDRGKVLADYKLEDLLTRAEIRRHVDQTVSSRWRARQAVPGFSPDRKYFVITLKWSNGLSENLKGIKAALESIKDEAKRKDLQELILKVESEVPAQEDQDR